MDIEDETFGQGAVLQRVDRKTGTSYLVQLDHEDAPREVKPDQFIIISDPASPAEGQWKAACIHPQTAEQLAMYSNQCLQSL